MPPTDRRTRIPRVLTGVGVICIVVTLVPSDAFAYLDPGTGSYVLQIVIGVLLGAAFALKVFWLRVRTFFRSLFSRKTKGK